jgi:hypothetical protein
MVSGVTTTERTKMSQMLYVKIGDEYVPYDESKFWSVALTSPDREKVIRGKATPDAVETFQAALIDRKEGKPVGRRK